MRQLRLKERDIKRKMQEIDQKRIADQEVKKERLRLVMEDA